MQSRSADSGSISDSFLVETTSDDEAESARHEKEAYMYYDSRVAAPVINVQQEGSQALVDTGESLHDWMLFLCLCCWSCLAAE